MSCQSLTKEGEGTQETTEWSAKFMFQVESLIKDKVLKHTEQASLKHSFHNGKSCLTNLLESSTRMWKWVNTFVIIGLDFWKMFDTVSHQRLLRILQATILSTLSWE